MKPACKHTERAAHSRGVTLVELMVVVAIVGVLSALSFFLVKSTSYAGTPRGFTEQIAAVADTARLRAVATRKWQRLEFLADRVEHWEADLDGMGPPNNWVLMRTIFVPRNVEIAAVSTRTHLVPNDAVPGYGVGLGDGVQFAPDGAGQAGTVFIGDTFGKLKSRAAFYRATGSVYVFEGW